MRMYVYAYVCVCVCMCMRMYVYAYNMMYVGGEVKSHGNSVGLLYTNE